MVCRFRNFQLIKEDIRHVGIKVLPSMHDLFCDAPIELTKRAGDYRCLDELWPSSDDCDDFQFEPSINSEKHSSHTSRAIT